MARVRLVRAAARELEEIHDGLRRYSEDAARRAILAVLGKIDLLREYPELGRMIEDREGVQYRQTVAGSYVIRYRFDPQHEVLVLSIRHGRRRQADVSDLENRV